MGEMRVLDCCAATGLVRGVYVERGAAQAARAGRRRVLSMRRCTMVGACWWLLVEPPSNPAEIVQGGLWPVVVVVVMG